MKKLSIIIASALCLVLAASCGQRNKAAEQENPETKTEAQIQAEALIKVHLDSLANELVKINPVGILGSVKDGKIVLSDKEKQVKPEYLADPAIANDLQTLSQKYRAIAVIAIDSEIAKLYGMPVDSYNAALAKLYSDVNDPALKAFSEGMELKESINSFYEESKKNERENLFWETVSAALVEQMFIVSQNSDKFIAAFDDQSVTDFTWDVVLLTLAVEDLANVDSEYAYLNETIQPLTKIDAISVDQFKGQLDALKSEMEVSRATLLK
ncbi:MAG: hypothetical protein KBT00_05920 [Bacteroidales bacterium]|nr:hypothetical protein [Candidatus Cacconaster merdequi]